MPQAPQSSLCSPTIKAAGNHLQRCATRLNHAPDKVTETTVAESSIIFGITLSSLVPPDYAFKTCQNDTKSFGVGLKHVAHILQIDTGTGDRQHKIGQAASIHSSVRCVHHGELSGNDRCLHQWRSSTKVERQVKPIDSWVSFWKYSPIHESDTKYAISSPPPSNFTDPSGKPFPWVVLVDRPSCKHASSRVKPRLTSCGQKPPPSVICLQPFKQLQYRAAL